MTHYITQTATAHMPNSCWGRYGKVGVLEVEDGIDRVSMISDRARGAIRVVEVWDRQFWGKSNRCAFAIACREAEALAASLNGG
jgi:hypothetical protein|tara:strand:+ start:200 stop:451 length:252 start_codon:yes stop_codon:yes gene_type:complete